MWVYFYTPLDKNIRPPSKMKEKIVSDFYIMKIRYMKDKVKRHLKYEETSIHYIYIYI